MDYPKVKVCLDTSEDNLIDELYTPCLKWAERFDRGVGYFTTGWLTYNVAGLSDFASRGGKMRLITSPILSTEDTDAIIGAENQDGSAFLRLEAALLENVEILKQEMEADIINAFSWMLYDGIIDMRFAIPCEKLEEGDFHDKFGIFYKGNDALSFSGSINDSKHGFQNYESIKVFKTWAGTQEYVDADTARFEKIWNRKDRNLKIFTIPQAVKNKIFELRSPDRPYSLPAGSSKWVHQDIAVKTFLEKEHDILAMATGTGKTVTAMKIINKLFDSGEIRRVVITMYGNDLLDQWAIQIRENYKNKQINYLLSESLCARMFELGNSMKKLKLPKTIAKDFFTELASADRCVCDRCIGERERTAILKRADQYLGSDQQSVLNTVKSSLMDSVYDERLKKAFEELEELRAQANRLDTRFKTNEEKLIKAGGEKARELQERIEELIRLISIARDELERIESKDENDASLTEENNLHKADQKFKYYEQEIAKATRTNTALRKKELVDSLVNEIKLQATTALKQEIVRKTNEKLRRVIVDDYVEIESIDRYIKLKGRDGASEGQTLSIAYCFLGTLFEDSELEFPFIIDSPTGKMDFEKRQAVADIIPLVFNQMIAFVQSAEVERFADRFYANPDSQYLTVVASPQDQAVVVYEGIDFFDSYQREHKGDEK